MLQQYSFNIKIHKLMAVVPRLGKGNYNEYRRTN